MTRLKRISIKRFCMDSAANATTPGGFWKRLKPLLPSSGLDNSDETCIINDGVVVNEPSNLFNEYFSTPALSQDVFFFKYFYYHYKQELYYLYNTYK